MRRGNSTCLIKCNIDIDYPSYERFSDYDLLIAIDYFFFFFFFLSLDLVHTSTASMEKIKPIGCSGSPLFCPALHLELNSHRFESLPQNRVSSCGAARAGLVHWEALMLSEVISVPIQNFLCFS